MPINPYIDLFGAGPYGSRTTGGTTGLPFLGRKESPWGDLATLGGGLFGAAGGGGLSWMEIIPMVVALFGELFGKKEDPLSEAMDLKRQMEMLGFKKPYQSPYLPGIDQATYQAILNQLKRTSNWGWPEGQQMDLSWLDALIERGPVSPGGRQLVRAG